MGHWHYAHYYYAQVMYRGLGKDAAADLRNWKKYRDSISDRIFSQAHDDGKYVYWDQGYIGAVYTTSINLTILQLENGALPIYQR